MRMESLNAGVTTPRTVRVPDPLWDKLTHWAKASGLGEADALRELLRLGLDNPPTTPLRPAFKWMLNLKEDTDGMVLATVTAGREWWELDNVLGEVPGAHRAHHNSDLHWWLIPAEQMEGARELFAGMPDRLRLYRLDRGRGE